MSLKGENHQKTHEKNPVGCTGPSPLAGNTGGSGEEGGQHWAGGTEAGVGRVGWQRGGPFPRLKYLPVLEFSQRRRASRTSVPRGCRGGRWRGAGAGVGAGRPSSGPGGHRPFAGGRRRDAWGSLRGSRGPGAGGEGRTQEPFPGQRPELSGERDAAAPGHHMPQGILGERVRQPRGRIPDFVSCLFLIKKKKKKRKERGAGNDFLCLVCIRKKAPKPEPA